MTPELAQIASCSIMHPDKQRIAIAEACGCDRSHCEECGDALREPSNMKNYEEWSSMREDLQYCPSCRCGRTGIPDYVNSLDEMHEAEKVIPAEYWYNYSEHLFDVAGLGDPHDNPNLNYGEMRPLLQLTARQRAEAFLRTLNKWKEPSHV
jgi:hypothetical protein